MFTLECQPSNPAEFSESCDFTGVPPTAPPANDCGPNEIPVSCDSCDEAFCCDSGQGSVQNTYTAELSEHGNSNEIRESLLRIVGMSKRNDETSTWL